MKNVMIVVSKGIVSHVELGRVTQVAPKTLPRLAFGGRVRAVQYSESHSDTAKLVFGAVPREKGEGRKRPAVVHTCI